MTDFLIDFRAEVPTLSHDSGNSLLIELASGPNYAWCYGELLSYDGSDGSTADCSRRAVTDWELDRLKPVSLNGRFVLILWHAQRREWHIITDRVGAMHAYAAMTAGGMTALGSDLGLVKRCGSGALDWEGITSLFAFGFFLDERTHFSDVKILQPHTWYRLGQRGELLEQREYWQWRHEVDAGRSYTDTVEQYNGLLRRAVARCTAQGRIALPLSGGLDSRSIAAVAPHGSIAAAYSYGYTADSIETRIAAQIASAQHLPFTSFMITSYLADRLDEITRALHGCQDVTQARQVSVSGWLDDRADAVLTGLWGDVWCDHTGLADGLNTGGADGQTLAATVIKKFQKRGRAWLLDTLCAPRVEAPGDLLADAVAAGLARYDHLVDLDFRVKAYKTARWAFRWSNASLRGFEIGAVPRIPYYDTDLIDFFCTVPTDYVRDRRLQIDHLKRYAPAVARVRWQEAGANLYRANYGRWLSLPQRAVNKARRTLTGQRPIQRNWEVQFLSPGGCDLLRDRLLRPGLKLHEWASPASISSLLDGFYAQPDAANGYTVSMLLTFAVWMEYCS